MSEVYRMKFVPTIMDGNVEIKYKNSDKYAEIRGKIFNLFQEHGFLGTGWYEMDLEPGMSKNQIVDRFNKLVKDGVYQESDRTSTIAAAQVICSLKKDDLIWVKFPKGYYLFRVEKNACGKNWEEGKLYDQKDFLVKSDIGNLFFGVWYEVGDMSKVPGIIVNSMGVGKTFMHKKDAPELSQMKWNEVSKSEYYLVDKTKFTIDSFWKTLTDREVEGLVLLYIQYKYDCMVNTETLKHSQQYYECELVGKNGIRYYPQVKTGGTSVDTKTYFNTIKHINKDGIALVFFGNEKYGDFKDKDLILIRKEELLKFIEMNEKIIPNTILSVYSLIKDKMTNTIK